MTRTVLVTGGAGFIGSHVCVDLREAGDEVVVVDDLSNSSAIALERVARLTGAEVPFHRLDLRDRAALAAVFAEHPVDAVIHCAGLKAVGESVEQPLRYWHTNLDATFSLLETMEDAGVFDLVFSSSATVYADHGTPPFSESAPLGASNPYGRTKEVIEYLLSDVSAADDRWRIVALRYFNPVGAHPSGLLGEDPGGRPNNLMPRVLKAATGEWDAITVFGTDYDTPDGTGVRDYLHVCDLASGHRAAIDSLEHLPGFFPVNLGTGTGVSVLQLIEGVERASGRSIERDIQPRRSGDVASSYASVTAAREHLRWEASRGLDEMCADAWRFAVDNPRGYEP